MHVSACSYLFILQDKIYRSLFHRAQDTTSGNDESTLEWLLIKSKHWFTF